MNDFDWLRRYPLYALLGSRVLGPWLESGREHEFDFGETLFTEGGKGEWAYLLLEGKVRSTRRCDEGRELTTGIHESGDLIGDYAILPPHCNTATCRASAHTKLVRLPLKPLRDVLLSSVTTRTRLKRWLQLHMALQCLRGRAFLGFMRAHSATRWLSKLHVANFHTGTTVQTEGIAEGQFFFIESGEVEKVDHNPSNPAPSPLRAGECFGEGWLADEVPDNCRTVSFVAKSDIVCHVLQRADFVMPSTNNDSLFQSVFFSRASNQPRWIAQQSESDCGHAALAMLAACFGVELESSDDFSCRLQPTGLSLLHLQFLADRAGLTARAVKIEAHQLSQIRLPVIAHFNNGHYVCLFDRQPGHLTIADPSTGIIQVSTSEFTRQWSGNLLLVNPR